MTFGPFPPYDSSKGARQSCDTKVPERLLSERHIPWTFSIHIWSSRIIPFLHRVTSPTVSLLNQENITSFITSDETVFIAYISPENHHLHNTYTALATKYHSQYSFGLSTSFQLAKSASLSIPSIVCIRPNEGEQEVLSGEARLDQIEKFIETATAPIIGEFTRRNEMKYMKVTFPSYLDLTAAKVFQGR